MGDVLNWFSNNPVILTIVITTICLFIVFFITVATVAIFQGRSVTFWPPHIGKKPLAKKEEEVRGSLEQNKRDQLAAKPDIVKAPVRTTVECRWTSPHPLAKEILQNAENMVLLVGTSLHRIVHSDFFEYREWLQQNPTRFIGLMFLNPHSPHALGRERKDVQRSSQNNIIESIRLALAEAGRDPHVLIAIHDGPFRYSARAVDIGKSSSTKGSHIQIISSSHIRGISAGFEIILKPSNGEPYQYYEKELMDVWKQTKANKPGHGVSVIAKSNSLIDWETIEEFSSIIIQALGDKKLEFYEFNPEQHHLTLSSLCRTQLDVLGEPLSVGETNNENTLPNHYGEFLVAVIEKTIIFHKNPTTVIFDKIVLDKYGNYSLASSSTDNLPLLPYLRNFHNDIQKILDAFATKYPNEKWQLYDDQRNGFRFGPKPNGIVPHITLGMIFKQEDFFPLPLKGVEASVVLSNPINYRLDNIIIGHYAYRSYLRTVGEIHIDSSKNLYNPLEVLLELGISNLDQPKR